LLSKCRRPSGRPSSHEAGGNRRFNNARGAVLRASDPARRHQVLPGIRRGSPRLPPLLSLVVVGHGVRIHHSRRPRKRSCDSITDNSSCARFKPARPLSGLWLRSLSIRRSAAATRSLARSKSATVYCRGSGRVRFFLGPFVTLLAGMAALSRFPLVIVPPQLFRWIDQASMFGAAS